MKHLTLGLAPLGLTLLAAALGAAETTYSSAETGARWMNLPSTARVTSLGSAGSAGRMEAPATALNPAAAGGVEGSAISFSHLQEPEGAGRDRLSWVQGLGSGNSAILDLDYTSLGQVETYEVDSLGAPVATGTAEPYGLKARAGWAGTFGSASLGVVANFLQQDLAGQKATAFGLDLGLQGSLGGGVDWGAQVLNLGTELDGSRQPLQGGVGAAWSVPATTAKAYLDGRWAAGDGAIAAAGLELGLTDSLAIRGGYRAGDSNARRGFSVGAGYSFGVLGLDYAFDASNPLGATHLFTLNSRWGGSTAPSARVAMDQESLDRLVTAVIEKDYQTANALEKQAAVGALKGLGEPAVKQANETLKAKAVEPSVFGGRFSEAQRTLEVMATLEPNNAYNEMALGYMLVHQQQPDLALPHLKRALELDPSRQHIATTIRSIEKP